MASNADVTSIASEWKEQLEELMMEDFDASDVKEELGQGLYGETFVVSQNGAAFRTKKIHLSIFSKDEFRNNFTHDCLQMSRLRHPHLAPILGVQIEDSLSSPPLLISEFYPLTLSSCLQKYPEMPSHSKYSILQETTVGIDYLHSLSPPVSHGHLTPNNILLTEGLHVKIADCVRFGLDLSPIPNSPYQAPEEVRGEAGDVFSLGDIMLHVALQREPSPLEYKHHRNLENKNEPVILTEIKRRDVFLLQVDDDNVLKSLVLQCLEEEPSQRPTPKTLIEELGAIVKEHEPEYHNVMEMFLALGQLALMKETVSSQELTVSAKEEEIEALKEQIEFLNEDIGAKGEAITAVQEEMEGYKKALQSKEGRIKAHETQVRSKESLLKAKDREIAAKKQTLASKEGLLKASHKRITALEQFVKASRKKGSNPPPIPPPDMRFMNGHGSSPLSPESMSGGYPPQTFPRPYRGLTSPMFSDAPKTLASTTKAADPQLAKILARRQKTIDENEDNIHETKEDEMGAGRPLRKWSSSQSVPVYRGRFNI
jgi:serine/threonine protein kinase